MKLVLAFISALPFAAPVLGVEPLPPHPRLLFNAAVIAQLRQRVQQEPWIAQWKAFRSDFDKTLNTPVELPLRGGNWPHRYVCPTHGAALVQGRQIGPWQWEHICPVDNAILSSDPTKANRDFDGVVIGGIHTRYSMAILDAAILYQVTGDVRYARYARAILLGYAGCYRSYPLHTIGGNPEIGGGRIGSQSLDESVWLIPLAHGADLIWETLSDTDRQLLTDDLFLPAVRGVILPSNSGISNIQCWKNSAIGLTGFLLGDSELIKAAIDNPARGYHKQMAKGVLADGCWFEGAWTYHFYTLNAIWPLTEAARNCNINLYGEPLRKMFAAPINLATPGLILPAFNDSHEVNIRNGIFELAYARYGDPVYLVALADSKRNDKMALWFGLPQLPSAKTTALSSRNAAASGYAILQHGAGKKATWLCLKYGPHGGNHGHPDKNSFILYTRGRVICPDPGARLYGSPLHKGWDKVTLAHNTLVVDEADQTEAVGQCLAFGSEQGCDFAMTEAGPIAKGVRFVRTAIMLNENLIVFVDQVSADKPHTFDLATHCNGEWLQPPPGAAIALPTKNGYQHLKTATLCRTDGTLTQTFVQTTNWRSSITLAGGEPTEVITATGVGDSVTDRIPMTIFRRKATQSTFVWALALDGAPLNLQAAPQVNPHLDPSVTVRADSATSSWQIAVNTATATVHITPLATMAKER